MTSSACALRKTVILDTDETFSAELADALTDFNYEVFRAEDRWAAQRLIEENGVALLLLGMGYSREAALENLRWAKARFPCLEVVILSAGGHFRDGFSAMKLGAFDLLIKSENILEFVPVIDRAMEKAAKRLAGASGVSPVPAPDPAPAADPVRKPEAADRLSGKVVHDLNNILGAIEGYATLARNALPAGNPARSDMEAILMLGRRAAAITKQLRLLFVRRPAPENPPEAPAAGGEELPAKQADVQAPPAAAARGGRVLIMDDDAPLAKVLTRMLTGLGYQAEAVTNGNAALDAYREAQKAGHRPYDAVILDLSASDGMDGRETMARLMALNPATKAIISSGTPDDQVMADYTSYGFSGTLPKPYKLKQVLEAMSRLTGSA